MQKSETARRAKEAQKLKREGRTYAYIATILGVSRQRVQQLVRPPKQVYDAVVARAKGRCGDCRIAVRNGHVHHEDVDAELHFNDIANLEYLCQSCHQARHPGNPKVRAVLKKSGYLSPFALRAIRRNAGLTQAEFGAKLGCDGTTISRYESGSVLAPQDLRTRLIEARLISRRKALKTA